VELSPRRSPRRGMGEHDESSKVVSSTSAVTQDSTSVCHDTPATVPNHTQESGPLSSESHPTWISIPDREYMSPFITPSATQTGVQNDLTQGNSSPEPSIHLEDTISALVVDDDYITRQLMARLLTRLGVSVTCAENGAIALDLILGTDGAADPSKKVSAILGICKSKP
jgi:osomolarity two-component system, sensor histidine kinase SLN1